MTDDVSTDDRHGTDELLLTYYGDDFTGSTDALEALSTNGVRTVLFLEEPSSDDLDSFDDVQAVGLAGTSRSMTPEEMDEHLPSRFESLAALDADVFHYKVCSTFDSSPEVGSIGHAIDVGQEIFDSPFVPLVVAVPSFESHGRYVAFGNLFATVDSTTYRIDRHPTMSNHPVTPMTEGDLRRHLGEQTAKDVGLVEVVDLDGTYADATEALDASVSSSEIVLFDGLTREHQRRVGRLVWERTDASDETLFAVGSSGFEYAVTNYLRENGVVGEEQVSTYSPEPVDRIVVMSGSASPVTDRQIGWALNNGFEGIRLDTKRLVDPETAADERERAVEAGLRVLEDGQSPLLYSARGPDDPAIEETKSFGAEFDDIDNVGRRLGTQQGMVTAELLDRSEIGRLCVAGGDTSGHVTSRTDVFALEFVATVGPGSPLCLARSRTPKFDDLEVALKGGQIGTTNDEADYFGLVRDGGVRSG